MGHIKTAIAVVLGLASFSAAQEAPRSECKCKPREVGASGSKVDWPGYRNGGIAWHYEVNEALAIAAA